MQICMYVCMHVFMLVEGRDIRTFCVQMLIVVYPSQIKRFKKSM